MTVEEELTGSGVRDDVRQRDQQRKDKELYKRLRSWVR